MLQGRVRVTNVEFSEALRDEDSEEHRAFLRLFLSTVGLGDRHEVSAPLTLSLLKREGCRLALTQPRAPS